MYLKTVTIHGFKSFAHPVSVEFSPGLNVVVGPNGSGKSNLIDALRWILGERKGGHQVFFHGSAKYRPLGMASVELTFEGDGVPPFRVEKRAFASGETEYFFQGSKIRLGELRRELAELGLSLHRLEVGFVTNHDLHALSDLSPLECLHWLEEASGILEMRTRLARLSRTLQSVVEKRERFRERLREIAFQRARVAEWAEKEEEYLRREKRWQGARKAYLTKLLENLRGNLTSLCEEESFCDQELHRLSVEQSLLNLDAEERQLLALQNTLRSLRREVEEGKRSIAEKERELYQLLTEMRGRKERYATLENRGKELLEEIRRLEKEREFLVPLPDTLARLAKTEQVISRFIDEREEELRFFKAREQRAREESIRLETMLRSVENEYKRFSREQEELVQEVESLKGRLAALVAKAQEYESRRRDLEQRKEDASRRLARIRELLLKVRAKRREVEVQDMPDRVLEEVRSGLASMGWPNRAVHGLLGLLKTVQVFKGEHIPQESGKWVVPYVFLPPFSQGWATKRREEIFSYLQGGRDPDWNLVALDGSVILLKGGFFFFPRR
ncbi:MAG: AAA family ATPase, partial [Candidatus Caldatribacterium sp.]|nr:AAA family ATPase [Candidatus Caldatribacterium sp.]